jgi:hypothetical protein
MTIRIRELEQQVATLTLQLAEAQVDIEKTTAAWAISADDRDEANGLKRAAESKVATLIEEVKRLKAGRFTEVEIHEICHNLHWTVDAQAFADGCAEEQRKLYGCAPDRDIVATLTEALEKCAQLSDISLNTFDRIETWIVESPHGGQTSVMRRNDVLNILTWLRAEAKLIAAQNENT